EGACGVIKMSKRPRNEKPATCGSFFYRFPLISANKGICCISLTPFIPFPIAPAIEHERAAEVNQSLMPRTRPIDAIHVGTDHRFSPIALSPGVFSDGKPYRNTRSAAGRVAGPSRL